MMLLFVLYIPQTSLSYGADNLDELVGGGGGGVSQSRIRFLNNSNAIVVILLLRESDPNSFTFY